MKENIFIFIKINSSLLIICLLYLVAPLYAQNNNFIFRHINENDGLINNKITVIYQDGDGFMWIGSQLGLQRYDGSRFKNYRADIRDTAALQTDWISAIFEDSKKRLWIGTDHGAPYILNRITGKFYNFNLHTSASNTITGIWHFVEDKDGNIWIAGHRGYYKLNEKTNQFENQNLLFGNEMNIKGGTLTFDAQNNFWMATNDGVKCYNTKEKKLYGVDYNPHNIPLFNINTGTSKLVIDKNNFWTSNIYKGVIYCFNATTGQLKTYSFGKHPSAGNIEVRQQAVGDVFRLNDGQIIVPLQAKGLALYHPEADSFIVVNADNSSDYSFHMSGNVGSSCSIIQDREKNILIGNDLGINIYNKKKQSFFTHELNLKHSQYEPLSTVSDFLELPDGNILISHYCSNGGIVKVDTNFKLVKQYLIKGSNNLGTNQIWNLFEDRKGIVWAPNQASSIVKLDWKTETLINEIDTVLSGPINAIQQDTDDFLWLGHWRKGLVKYNWQTKEKYFFSQFRNAGEELSKNVQSILIDNNLIWAGTVQNGLQVFDKQLHRFTEAYFNDINNKNSISSNTVMQIIRYNKDTLVLATEMGINIFDIKKKSFKAITVKEGMPGNLVVGIWMDDHSNIWAVCSGGGFCKLNMQNFTVTNYDINDGITDNIFSGKIVGLKNGMALIAASNSFISFNPAAVRTSPPPANVLITGLSVFSKEILTDSLQKNNQPVELTYKENSLHIEFASLEFWAPGRIKYFYKLDGADKDWIAADKNQTAVYNQLRNGTYVFQVRCANRDGIFCKSITTLTIIIHPPFWKTWWFILLIAAAIIFALYAFIKWREQNINAINEANLKLQKLNAEQYKSKLELEQIINYFSSSLIDKNTVDDVLWDVAKNLISRLGFEDCMMYLWNTNKTKMTQRAGYGPKGTIEDIEKQVFEVAPGQGVVGHVIQTKEALLIADTSKDPRYRMDDVNRLSELTVPVIYNGELIGVIDSECQQRNFFTQQHLQVLSTIATLMANKIKSIESEQSLQQTKMEMLGINEKLSEAKLEALRSQMNPHFIFNSLNAIQECILTNKVEAAYEYLSKFSKLQRMVLNNSAKELIPLSSELEMLQLYLSLESLRFSQSFVYSITVNKEADADDIYVPSMIIQPYVENAIWHGFRNKTGEKKLFINCEEYEHLLIITIDDNGIGREAAASIKAQKLGAAVSKGMLLSEQMIDILSLKYNAQITIDVIDKLNDDNEPTGTIVIIKLPSDIEKNKT